MEHFVCTIKNADVKAPHGKQTGECTVDRTLLNDNVPQDAQVALCLLGRFDVRVAGKWIECADWTLRKARQLLVLLALAPNQRLHREEVIELLWPDFDPASAANNFRRTLYETRRTLAPAPAPFDVHIRSEGPEVALVNDSLWMDVAAFRSAAARALRERTTDALVQAIELYGGDLVPQERYDEWLSVPRERLRSTFLKLLLELADLYESRHELFQSIQACMQALELDPGHEDVHTRLMRLYDATGQRHLALRQYRALEEALRKELDVDPTPTSRQMYEQLLRGQPLADGGSRDRAHSSAHSWAPAAPIVVSGNPSSAPSAPGASAHDLPTPLTPFIARPDELDAATNLLNDNRLVTLTGMGGIGKSRIALEVARRVSGQFADGVRLVDLAEATDLSSIRKAMGETRAAGNTGAGANEDNRPKQQLIILDNCEHVAESCRDVLEGRLTSRPGTRLLVTSRHALGIPGEAAWSVPPMTVPDAACDLPPREMQRKYGSVQLFTQYATMARSDFQLTRDNAKAVVAICTRLEGNPLALKLAAFRMRMLTPEQIATLVDDPFAFLKYDGAIGPARHRTLRASVDRCYELLTPGLQSLFNRLAEFEGQFSLDDAAAAMDDGSSSRPLLIDVLNGLSSLAARSLLVVERCDDGGLCYRMPWILQRYGRNRLEQVAQNVWNDEHLNPTG